MRITETFKRRIRIETDPNDPPIGRKLHITDVETGETITNVLRGVIYLHGRKENQAILVYAEYDGNEQLVVVDGDVVEKTVTVDDPEIALTALERETEEQAE